MKKAKLSSLKDNTKFKRSLHSKVEYLVVLKERHKPGFILYSSISSGRTFHGKGSMVVYV